MACACKKTATKQPAKQITKSANNPISPRTTATNSTVKRTIYRRPI